MHSPLAAIVPLLAKRSESAAVAFGPIAQQLLKCVQAIHEHKHVVVDIKQENFMLADGTGKGSSVESKLASRIRILDLALVEPWVSIQGHRTNDGGQSLPGTPLYASLNVHAGGTVSRRDDLEALGYVMAELVMQIASGNPSHELPWSHGKSDEEIGSLKAAQVNDPESTFYKQLGSTAAIFQEYLATVREYSFKKTPDYETLSKLLSKIDVSTSKKKKPKVSTAVSNKRSTPASASLSQVSSSTRRVTRSRTRARDQSDFESPPAMTRDKFTETEEFQVERSHDVATLRASDDYSDDDCMDWEVISDENAAPAGSEPFNVIRGVTLFVDGGPQRGTAINLLQSRTNALVVGRDPVAKNGEGVFVLSGDSTVDDSHARIELWTNKKLVGVNITDLKSSTGIFHGRERIRKSMKIFSGDTVKLGATTIRVAQLDVSKVAIPPPSDSTMDSANAKRRFIPEPEPTESTPGSVDQEIETETSPMEEDLPKRRGLRLQVIQGPHLGDMFEIETGESDTVNVGSKPSGKHGKIALAKDPSLKPNHIQLKLCCFAKIHYSLLVTDKSTSGCVKINGGIIKQTGRASVNDSISIGDSVLKILGSL